VGEATASFVCIVEVKSENTSGVGVADRSSAILVGLWWPLEDTIYNLHPENAPRFGDPATCFHPLRMKMNDEIHTFPALDTGDRIDVIRV
jgi:hypothetical protein